MAPRMEGNQQQSQTNRKRSVLLNCGRFDTLPAKHVELLTKD
jgi:hypothetical protein